MTQTALRLPAVRPGEDAAAIAVHPAADDDRKGGVAVTARVDGAPVVLARLRTDTGAGLGTRPGDRRVTVTEPERAAADPVVETILRAVVARLGELQRERFGGGGSPVDSVPSFDLDALHRAAIARLELEADLERALDEQQLVLNYQPIVSLRDRSIRGFEALVRWQHPERGRIPPVEFIPAAEESGQIVRLGRWVLEEALRALGRLEEVTRRADPAAPPLVMSVNLSARQLADLDEIDRLAGLIAGSGVSPGQVKLEITETLMVADPEHAAEALHRLKALGVGLSIDDFGTGYSSLSYLHRFPLDTLKIDRSFVSRMMHDEGSMQIVRAIARLARDLGLQVVAEGIEHSEEIAVLRGCGCDLGQGFFIARPLEEADARELLEPVYYR